MTPAHAAGAVDVTVITPAGTTGPAAGDRFAFVEALGGGTLPEAPETGSAAAAAPFVSPGGPGFC